MEMLDHRIDPNLAALVLGLEQTEYDPEEFDGAVYLSRRYGAVVLILPSGRLIPILFIIRRRARSALEQLKEELEVLNRVDDS
jgi:transcription initiation factor TFIID TATA-box-binding protein